MVAAKRRPDFRAFLAAAVDRDRQVEDDVVLRVRQLGLELLQDLRGARSCREQVRLDLVERLELHELLLERARETATAEVPAVELLQEAGCAMFPELANRLPDEEQQLRDHLLAGRLGRVAVEDLAQRPRVALRRAADHYGRSAGRREDRLRPRAR